MFLSNKNDVEQFVNKLFETSKVQQIGQMLADQDQRQLLYAKNVMIQKMPRQLVSSKFTPQNPKIQKPYMVNHFPSMFINNDKKHYEYVDENVQNMKRIASTYNKNSIQNKIRSSRNSQITIKQQDKLDLNIDKIELDLDKKDIEQPLVEHKMESIKSSSSINKSQKKDHMSIESNNRFSNSLKKTNPFVPNNMNFTDLHANSKSINSKYPHLNFTQNSRNITALAQSAKHQAFSQSIAFPTTVMTGNLNPPKNNAFSKQSKLDIADIMRYTLGSTKFNTKDNPIQNPFARPPKRRQ